MLEHNWLVTWASLLLMQKRYKINLIKDIILMFNNKSTFVKAERLTSRSAFNLLLVAFASAAITSCGTNSDNSSSTNFDRSELLNNYADNIVMPAYEEYVSSTNNLLISVNDYALSPEDNNKLVTCIDQLKIVSLKWQLASLFDFGPASDHALLEFSNSYPTSTDDIELSIGDENWIAGQASNIDNVGLPALDYLLNEDGALDKFTVNPARIHHLVRLVEFLNAQGELVFDTWQSSYKSNFVSSTGTEMGSSIGAVLNSLNRVFEANIRKQKLGLPSGVSTFSGNPLPNHVEAKYANYWSIDLLYEAMLSIEKMYLGNATSSNQLDKDGVGFDDYLISLGDEDFGRGLHNDIVAQIQSSKEAVMLLNDPLSEFVLTNQETCVSVYTELQALVVLFKVDMMSSLGVLITYQDNDGD